MRENVDRHALDTLPHDILMLHIISYFDSLSIVSSLSSSCKKYRKLLLTNKIWESRCKILWLDKIYVHARYLRLPNIYTSYFGSIRDSKRCVLQGEEELCRLRFHFRFRPAVGEYWHSLDSSYMGTLPMYRQFKLDGTIATCPSELGSLEIDGMMPLTSDCVALPVDPLDSEEVRQFVNRIYWRMTKSRRRVRGQFVKINQWPSLHVGRTDDWGWTLTSLWTYYRTCCPETRTLSEEWMAECDDYEMYM